VIFTAPRQPRAISASSLSEVAGHFANQSFIVPDPADALARAMEIAGPEDVIFATGSLYLVGEILGFWTPRGPKWGVPKPAAAS
jgi:dihydrofolate synthase/folylpolyglutamate synthase